MAETRPQRVCDLCGQVDDHPRAVHLLGPDEAPNVPHQLILEVASRSDLDEATKAAAVEELTDPRSALRHHDCCASAGCPAGTCGLVLDAADARGKTGGALLAAIQRHGDAITAAFEDLSVRRGEA